MKTIAVLLVVSLVAGVVCAQTNEPTAKQVGKDVIAIVLGKQLAAKDKDKLNGLIFGALLEQFAKDNKIGPTEKELDVFVLKTEEKQEQHQIKMEEDRLKLMQELKDTSLSKRNLVTYSGAYLCNCR